MTTDSICIIGGGAAGLMAAIAAGREGTPAVLLERNAKLGIKILMSGGGRCNVTNTGDVRHLVESFPGNGRFLYSAFNQFTNDDIIRLLTEEGVETKVEDRGRVFPVRDTAKDIVAALERAARRAHAEIALKAAVADVSRQEDKFLIRTEDGNERLARCLIIATGGVSYPTSGTRGDGYRFAKSLGHTIVKPRPAIIAMETVQTWPASVKGVALRGVTVCVYAGGKRKAQYKEDVLFTHFGVSGPAVLNVSHQAVVALESHPSEVELGIRIDPDKSPDDFARLLQERIDQSPARAVKNLFDGWWPSSLTPVLLAEIGIDPDKKAVLVRKDERRNIASLLAEIRLRLKGPRPIEQAMVTAGGVDVREVNPKTMESKIQPGLFLAGEVLDVDGVSGGYNLQGAYSTGWVAGKSAALVVRNDRQMSTTP